MKKKIRNRKGFTLIELIVVIAILGILAAIAIPRFADLRVSSAVKADGSTAKQILNAARIQETETGKKVTALTGEGETVLQAKYLQVPSAGVTGATFSIGGGGDQPYYITFTPTADYAPYNVQQLVRENQAWTPSTTAVNPE